MSINFNLSDLMEELFEVKETNNDVSGSIVMLVDKKTAKDFAHQARRSAKRKLLELSGVEDVSLWHSRDRSMDGLAPGAEGSPMAITAGVRYALS